MVSSKKSSLNEHNIQETLRKISKIKIMTISFFFQEFNLLS